MLLYKDPTNHYLAVHPSLRFEAVAGFQVCNSGRPVPRPACEHFIRRWGGQLLDADALITVTA